MLGHNCSNYIHYNYDTIIADKTIQLPMTINSSSGVHVPECASYVMREEDRNNRWNLRDLVAKLTIDAASAAIAAGLVAPIVTTVDKYAFH